MYSICSHWKWFTCWCRKRNTNNKIWSKCGGTNNDILLLVRTTSSSAHLLCIHSIGLGRGKVQAANLSINFLFASCSYSCGYRKAFEDYVNILSEKYPQITVTGGNYDPPGMNMYFSKLIFAVKILLIVVIVSSFDIFGAIGQPTPSWWRHLLENKLYACMMIFFVGNMLEGQVSRLCVSVCVCKWNI